MFGIEVKMRDGAWKALAPPGGPPPYCFRTELEAETMARVLYPALMRSKQGELIRIQGAS
jgi:hypothetical protein